MNTLKNKVMGVIVAVLALFGIAGAVIANPTYTAVTVQTSSATNTPAYMTPGTATSTLVYNTASTTNKFKTEKATLVVRWAGVSPLAVLNINFEHSPDCIDYYKSYLVEPFTIGTTSPTFSVLTPNSITWTFASSTLAGVAPTAANGATSTAIFNIPTPTMCTRVVFTNTGAAGAVWGQIVPVKELQ